MPYSLRVAVDVRIVPGEEGGIEQFLIGLLRGLGELPDGSEQYMLLTRREHQDWVRSYADGAQFLIVNAPTTGYDWLRRSLGSLRGPLRALRRLARRTLPASRTLRPKSLPASDGFVEKLGADVLHIPYPGGVYLSSVPTVFNVFDLQHRHFPEFFTPSHIEWREAVYPVAFRSFHAVVAPSAFTAEDLRSQYQVAEDKLYAIPLASPTPYYGVVDNDQIAAVRRKFGLPQMFMMYPALTYEHKNHVRLLQALALLRQRHAIKVHLVCTGRQKLYWPEIQRELRTLDLEDQARFLGFVSPIELRALYALADVVVLPSLFEGVGLPLLEAFHERKPVICSDIAAFQENGAGCVLFFDPSSVESIGEAVLRVFGDGKLRNRLAEAGYRRSQEFACERMARTYRALYRRVAGRSLCREDTLLLAPPQATDCHRTYTSSSPRANG